MITKTKGERSQWETWREKLARAAPSFKACEKSSEHLSYMFGDFCRVSGLVLDVGSGPRMAPYLMSGNAIRCVGLDPLDRKESGFDFICGVGESLPFGSSTFDHCVSGTTLDHCVRPDVVLKEMRRVTKESGKISLWIGCWAQDGTFDQPKTRTQSLPNVQEQSAVSRGLAQDAKDAWIILMRGDFPFLLKAIQIRLARVTRSLRLLIPHRLSARSDPYHLHHFREKDIDAMLRSAGLFVLKEKKLPDGSLFLTASVNTV